MAEIAPTSPLPVLHDRRVLQARLQIVVDSLTATIVFNPLFTAIFVPALVLSVSPFGRVPASHLWLAEGLQFVSAAVAFVIYRRYRRVEAEKVLLVERLLIASQALFSGVWGTIAFLFWLPGNPVNQILVIMIISLVGYAVVLARSVHLRLLSLALAVQGGAMFLRLVTAGEPLAQIMAPFIVIYTIYLWLMGRGFNRQIEAMIAARFVNEDLAAALRVARDDALRKRYEAETANASKTAFLANMSHELRTPLNAILGFSEIIANQSMGRGPRSTGIPTMPPTSISSGDHLLSLINDMLDVAKIESGRMEIEPQWVNPRDVMDSVDRLMGPARFRNTNRWKSNSPRYAPGAGRRTRLSPDAAESSLQCREFTPEAGILPSPVRSSGAAGWTSSSRTMVLAFRKTSWRGCWSLSRRSTTGSTARPGGTGLGLALVDGLVRLHGGKISLQSSPGTGLTAVLYFPSTMPVSGTRARA